MRRAVAKHKRKKSHFKGIVASEDGPQKKCARGSFRTKVVNATTQLILCCPPGKWSVRGKKCKVGMKLHAKHTMG